MLLIKHKLALMNMHFYTLDGFFRVYKSSFLQYSSAILQHTAIKQGAVMFCAPEHALQLHTVLPGLVVQVWMTLLL